MAITEAQPQQRTALPSRFREDEARGARLGRGIRRFGGISGEVDEQLMTRIGAALLERDEPGAALAQAMQTRADDADKVSHAQLRAALHSGQVPDGPAPLRRFMSLVSTVPDWVDWELVDRGGRLFTRMGPNAADVLMQLSLIGGYRFGGPTDLLVATNGLTGGRARRRLAETQHWATTLSGAEPLHPGGEAWRLTVHVRVMHALINRAFEPKWDIQRWGLPVNQTDQAGTLGLFDGAVLIGCRALGVRISESEGHAFMHMWKYVGWLMGVEPDFLTDDERERHRINYHILLAAPRVSSAGPLLARGVLEAQTERRFDGWPAQLQQLRGRLEQERLLSMLTGFLGPSGMRELELPLRAPWAFVPRLALNVGRYWLLDSLPGGIERRERWGRAFSNRLLASYFRDEDAAVAGLP